MGSWQYNGITNYFHTPFFVDLVNKGSAVIPDFQIPSTERFVDPNKRKLLYVPGSPTSTLSIVGEWITSAIWQL